MGATSAFLSRTVRLIGRRWRAGIFGLLLGAVAAVVWTALVGGAFSSFFIAALSIAACIGIVAFLELVRGVLNDEGQIQPRLGQYFLAGAPPVEARALRQFPPDLRSPLGAVVLRPDSRFAKGIRDLQHSIGRQPAVSVLGSAPGEGATTVAMCYAASASLRGLKVLVIDCDLRRASLTRRLGIEASEGLFEAAWAPAEGPPGTTYAEKADAAIQTEPHAGFDVLPMALGADPGRDLFSAPNFATLLRALSDRYDLMILDCPPALVSTDARMIAAGSTCCVLVAQSETTRIAVAKRSIGLLERARAVVAGVFLNRYVAP